jgi:hypothetical protein
MPDKASLSESNACQPKGERFESYLPSQINSLRVLSPLRLTAGPPALKLANTWEKRLSLRCDWLEDSLCFWLTTAAWTCWKWPIHGESDPLPTRAPVLGRPGTPRRRRLGSAFSDRVGIMALSATAILFVVSICIFALYPSDDPVYSGSARLVLRFFSGLHGDSGYGPKDVQFFDVA